MEVTCVSSLTFDWQNSVVMATCNTTGREVRSSFSEEETHMQMWGNVTTHALPIHIENSPSTSVILVVIIQSLSHVRLFVTPWTAAHQASLSLTISQSLIKLMSIKSVMPSNHLILCCPFLLLPSIFPSIRVSSGESSLSIRWPKYWVSASASGLPMNVQDWFPLGWTGWISLQSKGLLRVFSSTTVKKHQFFGAQLSSQSNSHIHTWPLEKT